jgi:hypothetical protein
VAATAWSSGGLPGRFGRAWATPEGRHGAAEPQASWKATRACRDVLQASTWSVACAA